MFSYNIFRLVNTQVLDFKWNYFPNDVLVIIMLWNAIN